MHVVRTGHWNGSLVNALLASLILHLHVYSGLSSHLFPTGDCSRCITRCWTSTGKLWSCLTIKISRQRFCMEKQNNELNLRSKGKWSLPEAGQCPEQATLFNSALRRGFAVDDLQRSLLTSAVPWFCKMRSISVCQSQFSWYGRTSPDRSTERI